MNMTFMRTHLMNFASGTKRCRIHPIVPTETGLYLRAAALLAKTATTYAAQVRLVYHDQTINAKNVLDILALGAAPGAQITVLAEGDDAGQALRAIEALFARSFCN